MKTVLFACVHNAGRSQMAAAWFNRLADPAKAVALSAGTEPGPHDWPLGDPKGQPIERVRQVRDDVERRVRQLVRERRWGI
jgi:arsenate reductase